MPRSVPCPVAPPRVRLPRCVCLRRSPLHGWGMFARAAIPDGTRIIEYVGERITKAEAQRREERRLARAARGGDACIYVFHLNRRHDLDGGVPWNPARRINHSCAPNCKAWDIRGRIWILARRAIAPGEELTYDYAFGLAEGRDHPCRCGARGCVGRIVAAGQRWRLRRLRRPAGAAVQPGAARKKSR